MSNWTTRLLPELTSPYGVEEVHNVWFAPKGYTGKGAVVALLIPECEMQVHGLGPDGAPHVLINRPKTSKKVKSWVRTVCEIAEDQNASVSFACDTAVQAERVARMASKLLPNHERAALERMYRADTRARGHLS
jgi:hypothetical protein